jgi:hypothetical protein
MDISKIIKAAKSIEDAEYNIGKFRIFDYETLDEADSGKDRIRSDVTVEIGGPSTHIKFIVLTRSEHTMIKDVIAAIFKERLTHAQDNLICACKEIIS